MGRESTFRRVRRVSQEVTERKRKSQEDPLVPKTSCWCQLERKWSSGLGQNQNRIRHTDPQAAVCLWRILRFICIVCLCLLPVWPSDLWPLPSGRRTVPSWWPVSREEPTTKHFNMSPHSWETEPPNRWERVGLRVRTSVCPTECLRTLPLLPSGEPSFPGPDEAFPFHLPKVHFLIPRQPDTVWSFQTCCCGMERDTSETHFLFGGMVPEKVGLKPPLVLSLVLDVTNVVEQVSSQ